MKDYNAEKVSETYERKPGQPDERVFWIAYPDHVAAYGAQSDRIARAYGRGNTKEAALADANERGRSYTY